MRSHFFVWSRDVSLGKCFGRKKDIATARNAKNKHAIIHMALKRVKRFLYLSIITLPCLLFVSLIKRL